MKVLVLTGGIGSGKSTVLSVIKDEFKQAFCLKADDISHKITSDRKFLRSIGVSSRKELRERMFVDASLKRRAEKSVHWRVGIILLKELLKAWFMGVQICVIELPIWFELPFWKVTKGNNILACAPLEMRAKRVMQRDGLSKEQFMQRINAQMPDEQKMLLADHVVHNDSDMNKLKEEINVLMRLYRPNYIVDKILLYYCALLLLILIVLFGAVGLTRAFRG